MRIFVAIFLLLPTLALAKDAKPGNAAPGELVSNYWLDDPVRVGGTFTLPKHDFTLTSGHGTGTDRNFDFAPPQTQDFSLTLGYGPFEFTFKFPLPQSRADRDKYGGVNYADYTLDFGRGRWAGTLYYQAYDGYYADLTGNIGNFARFGKGSDDGTDHTKDAVPSTTAPENILKRQDIHTKHYGAAAWHAFRLVGPDYQAFKISLNTQYEKPVKGFNLDLVHDFFYDHAEIGAGSTLIPASKSVSYGRGAGLTGLSTYSGGIGVGFATSYVVPGSLFFFDNMMLYGGGLQRQRDDFTNFHEWNSVYVNNFNLRLGFNFRNDKNQAGLHFWANTTSAAVTDVNLSSSNLAVELGYVRTI